MVKRSSRLALFGSIAAAVMLALSLAACGSGQGQSAQSSSAESSAGSSAESSAQQQEQAPDEANGQDALEQAGGQEALEAPTDVSGGSPWIDSNLKDNIELVRDYLLVGYALEKTYDVKEGDGMYLAPESRLLQW